MKTYFVPFVTIPIFNNLVRYNPKSNDPSVNNVVGDLAKKWDISADGKVYTFTLEQGVKWHDGQAFDAEDVVYSLTKIKDIKRSNLVANFPTVTTIEKTDAYTVKVTLSAPTPNFLTSLADGYAAIEPEHLSTVSASTTKFLVGTGPFMFNNYTSGVSFEFKKNPNYFRKDTSGNPLPYLDGMQYFIMADINSWASAFISEQTDMTTPAMGLNNEEMYKQITTMSQKPIDVNFYASHYGSVQIFNMDAS